MPNSVKYFSSIKSIVLAGAGLAFTIILNIAIYGQSLFQQTHEYSVEIVAQHDELRRLITAIKFPVGELEGLVFKHLLTLETTDKRAINPYLNEIERQIAALKNNRMIQNNEVLKQEYLNLKERFVSVSEEILRVSNFINTERFPALQTILNRIDPNTDFFNTEILILENLSEEFKNVPGLTSLIADIYKLKLSWQRSISSTRLMISSRTGIFGNPKAAIKYLDDNQKVFKNDIDKKYLQLQTYQQLLEDDFEFSISMDNIKQAIDERIISTKLLKEILLSPNWRHDVHLAINVIKPLIKKLISHTTILERRLEVLYATNLKNSALASSQLSNFLWLFAAIMLILLLLTYFIIEFMIRRPLVNISSAMNLEEGDITSRKLKKVGSLEIDLLINSFTNMQKQIQLRQHRLVSILQNAGEGIIVVNQLAEIDTVNQAAEKIFRFNSKDIIGKNFFSLIDPNLDEEIRKTILDGISATQSKQESKTFAITARGLLPTNRTFPFDLTISNMILEDRLFSILVIRDASLRFKNEEVLQMARIKSEKAQHDLAKQIKRLKQTQSQLIESEKMASLAGLVAGVSHEINTPVGIGVTAASHLHQEIGELSRRNADKSLTREFLEEYINDAKDASNIILNNLKRASELIRSFKQVAVDQSSEEIRRFNLKDYIDEIMLSLGPELKKTQHEIQINIPAKIEMVSSAGALSQIFTNLIFNTLIHAYDKGQWGIIAIEARRNRKVITIQYSDDGKGMDIKTTDKIFEPFFTTQRGTGGSGLGMHIVYNLVTTSLKGRIQCDSEPGQGTRFTLEIPMEVGLKKVAREIQIKH